MTNKYSEGRPGARYYGGNEHVDRIERLCEASSVPDDYKLCEDFSVSLFLCAAFSTHILSYL
jgi:hypothetical protein